MPSPLDTLLRDAFGHDGFRAGQREVAEAVLGGRDVVAVMPTGAGKSLCYQLPALLLEGTTVVVSPLIALMKDQVDALRALAIPAAAIHSGMPASERAAAEAELRAGRLRLVYAAPERLGIRSFRAAHLYQSGTAALEAGDGQRAVAELERAAALAPEASEVQNHLGLAYASQGRHADALLDFRRAVALDCDNAAAVANLQTAEAVRAQGGPGPQAANAP